MKPFKAVTGRPLVDTSQRYTPVLPNSGVFSTVTGVQTVTSQHPGSKKTHARLKHVIIHVFIFCHAASDLDGPPDDRKKIWSLLLIKRARLWEETVESAHTRTTTGPPTFRIIPLSHLPAQVSCLKRLFSRFITAGSELTTQSKCFLERPKLWVIVVNNLRINKLFMASEFVVLVHLIISNMSPTKLSINRSRLCGGNAGSGLSDSSGWSLKWSQEMRQNGRANQAP